MTNVDESPSKRQRLLEGKNIAAGYNGLQILFDVNIMIRERESVVLLGSNGAGKTTLMKALVSILPLIRGEIYIRAINASRLRTDQKVRLGVAFMSEQGIFPDLTVDENLRLGGYGLAGRENATRRGEMFELFPVLAERKQERGGSLSGGQRKMLGFAKALMQRPELLLLDEPSAGLSPRIVDEMIQSLRIFHERGVALFVAEQNIQFMDVAERGYVLDGGRIVASGTVSELRNNDVVHRTYFGLEDE